LEDPAVAGHRPPARAPFLHDARRVLGHAELQAVEERRVDPIADERRLEEPGADARHLEEARQRPTVLDRPQASVANPDGQPELAAGDRGERRFAVRRRGGIAREAHRVVAHAREKGMPLGGGGLEIEGRHSDRLEHDEHDVERPVGELLETRRGLPRAGGARDRRQRARDVLEARGRLALHGGEPVPPEHAAEIVDQRVVP
jgi:hypothetical protein